MKRVSLLLLLPVALCATVAAQQAKKQVAPQLHRATSAPNYAGVFSPIAGFTEKNAGRSSGVGARLILNNAALSPYYTIPSMDQEWIDDYYLQDLATDHSEQISGMEFMYCSSDPSPAGVSVTMNFYDESIYCGGPIHWPTADCSYAIPGLPGSVNGSLACWTVTLDLWGVECDLTTDTFGSKLTGWGQVWDNDYTGPRISQGDPGRTNYFTWFDTTVPNANAFQGCYWFGAPPDANFYIKLFGSPVDTNRYWADDIGGTSTAFDNGLLDVDMQVKAGNTCTFTVTDPTAVGFTHMKIFSSLNPAASPISAFGGNVLIDPLTATPQPVGGTSQSFTIPNLLMDRYTQAACFSNGNVVGFSNALRHQAL